MRTILLSVPGMIAAVMLTRLAMARTKAPNMVIVCILV